MYLFVKYRLKVLPNNDFSWHVTRSATRHLATPLTSNSKNSDTKNSLIKLSVHSKAKEVV
ncbi:MAG: hypothetical protein F6J90_06030 [Moorea sp. SIOASIH]|uniref:hypothetical protein n=1 Tax=Moorena sp. SIOASIH TaxID=2607817 RepID=UPI0013B842BE|nr:hypothetical protein [Moorena sp. SIOASIH]NEO35905.1 hypothetical protein [Moorena sp. SIOASIH]